MNLSVQYILDDAKSISITLRIQRMQNDFSFECIDENSKTISTDLLSSFVYFQISSSNHLIITFYKGCIERRFLFQSQIQRNTFFSLISQAGIIYQNCNDKLTYIIKDNDLRDAQSFSLSSMISGVFGQGNNNNNKDALKRPVDGFTFKTIDEQLPDIATHDFNEMDAKQDELENLNLIELNYHEDLFLNIYRNFIKVNKELNEDYPKLKEQWKSMTKNQWNHYYKFRVFVSSIEEWLDESFLPTDLHKELFFNISLTLFTHYYGELKFTPRFKGFLEIIYYVFLTDKTEDDMFVFKDGTKLTFENSELYLFGYVCSIWNLVVKDTTTPNQDFMSIRRILLDTSSSTFQILEEHKINSFEFFKDDYDVFFFLNRSIDDKILLFTAFLLSNNFPLFRQTIICISLVLLHNHLQLVPLNETKFFQQMFCSEFHHLNVKLLLHNYYKLHCKEMK